MAKSYNEVPVEKWNTRHFREFMQETHKRVIGIDYQPAGGWQREAGLLGDIVGTAKKPAKYDKAVIKEFIQRNIESYQPSAKYPGINFMFMWTWRKNVLQQIELEHNRKRAAVLRDDTEMEGIDEWL